MNPKIEPGQAAECVRHKEKIAQGERERERLWDKVDKMADNVSYIRGKIDVALKTNGTGGRHSPSPPPPLPVDTEAVTITIPKAIFLATLTTVLGAIATYLTVLR